VGKETMTIPIAVTKRAMLLFGTDPRPAGSGDPRPTEEGSLGIIVVIKMIMVEFEITM
jgi:hypothetical protein